MIETQVASRRRFYERNRVPVFSGEASFVDPHTLEVQPANGKPLRVSGKHIVIAAGSRPYHPPEVDFTHERIRDSDTILRYGQHPFSVTIYGAGVIGCEYASIFVNLGVKVTLVNTHDRLLSFLDDEIAEALSYHLREQGCVIRHNEQFKALEARERDVVLHLESGRKIKSDVLLWANGRTGNSNAAEAGERRAHQQRARADRGEPSLPDRRAAHLRRRRHRRAAGAGERGLRAGLARGRAHPRSRASRRTGWR